MNGAGEAEDEVGLQWITLLTTQASMVTELNPKRRASFGQAVSEAILVDTSGIPEHLGCIGQGATLVAAQDQ